MREIYIFPIISTKLEKILRKNLSHNNGFILTIVSVFVTSRAPTIDVRIFPMLYTGGTISQAQLTPIKREPQMDNKQKKDEGRVLPPESDADSSASSRGRDGLVVAAVIGPGNVRPLVKGSEHDDGRREL